MRSPNAQRQSHFLSILIFTEDRDTLKQLSKTVTARVEVHARKQLKREFQAIVAA
jgi:hypothetical protein